MTHSLALGRIWVIWAALAGMSLLAWIDSSSHVTTVVIAAVLELTTAKALLVIFAYMEVAWAPTWLRVAAAAWTLLVMSALMVMLGSSDLVRAITGR